MAKEDFCFTYYDGDALRDMSHMNRLERGAYNDLVLQQRKFGRMTIEQIKKILGKDFDECWPSVNLVLMFDEASNKYWIEWLEKSILEMRAHARFQSDRGKQGGRGKKKAEQKPEQTRTKPEQKQKKNLKEGGDGDVSEIEFKNKNESDFEKPDIEGDDVFFPIDTGPMRELWAKWKKYRWENFQLKYGFMGEQADLKRLEGMTYPQIHQTITAAMAGTWKNLYPEKNGKSNGTSKKQQQSEKGREYVSAHYETKPGSNSAN